MKSVRLTQDMRQKILGRLLTHGFGKQVTALRADDEAFGLAVYEDVYDKLARRRMKSMPEGYMKQSLHLTVAFGGQQDQVVWKGHLPIASKDEYDRAKSYQADHPLAQRRDILERRRVALRAEKEGALHKIKAVLASCTTIRQLVEIWPEAEEFVRDFVASGPEAVTALALPIKSLNEQLGLPQVVVPSPAPAKKRLHQLQISSTYGKFGKSGGVDARG